MSKNSVLRIPYGTRDFLPHEAAHKREIEATLADTLKKWGYDEIVTPTFEHLETLIIGNGDSLEPHMFKLFDRNNHTLALRHEMTTPIARVAASRLHETKLPLKLSYIANVYRYEQAQMGRQCEFNQAGVELMGIPDAAADAEIIALAISCLRDSGIDKFAISLGQVDFINGIMEASHISTETQESIKKALVTHSLVELATIVDQTNLNPKAKELIKKIPVLHGNEDMLKKTYELVMNEKSRKALDNLMEIYRLLEAYGIEEYIQFDLGVIRDFDYYTGMVFEGYTAGLGFPLCGGGRYDNMLSDFGNACPATGFALGIERIMLALERQGCHRAEKEKGIYIAWHKDYATKAIAEAQKLRSLGNTVELALHEQSEEEATSYKNIKGYTSLLYIK